jgi:hypothetical protein
MSLCRLSHFIYVLNVIMLSVTFYLVLNVIMLSVEMLSVIMMNVVMLSVVVGTFVPPLNQFKRFGFVCDLFSTVNTFSQLEKIEV